MKKARLSNPRRWILGVLVCLLSSQSAMAMRVACVGDSDTAGYGLDSINSYPVQLERYLKQIDNHWEAKNFGYSGATVIKQGDLPYTLQSVYQTALAYEPDVIVFQFGGNASRSQNRGFIQGYFLSDYNDLIQTFAQLPSKPKILICQPPAVFSSNWTISPQIIKDQIVPLVAQVASTWNAPLIDFYDVFKDLPHLYQSDNVHPTQQGAKLMAEMVFAFLTGIRANPDFNSDGIVDGADIHILVDHWGTDEPAYDITPPPFGDGIINVQDLVALAEYLFTYPGTVAHWELDETESDVAYDNAGENDGIVHGDALWLPDGGYRNGAIQLDGIGAYVETPFILTPKGAIFSVFAWVKGGEPGQSIISEKGRVNWLMADAKEGVLRTDISDPIQQGRFGVVGGLPLISPVGITDGNWHSVGFVWDGSDRILYVDDVEVAHDTVGTIDGSYRSLCVGTGKNLEPDTFWSGLIDDVRVYGRAVTP